MRLTKNTAKVLRKIYEEEGDTCDARPRGNGVQNQNTTNPAQQRPEERREQDKDQISDSEVAASRREGVFCVLKGTTEIKVQTTPRFFVDFTQFDNLTFNSTYFRRRLR